MLKDNLTINNITLQNRVVAEPIVTNSGDNIGRPTFKTMEIYRGYAQSHAGVVVVEQHAVHRWGRNKINQFRLYDDASAASLEPLTKLFRDKGIPVVAQLNFAGAGASGGSLLAEYDFDLVSPSGLRTPRDIIKTDSRALERMEIQAIIESFAQAAKRAVEISKYSGGVQIYACHGYLISQFLSPLTNKRTDEYGGSLQNRARLLFEIIEAVRTVIGDYPLSVRLGASDQMPFEQENGLTLAESTRIAEELGRMGIKWLGISGNHCIYGIGVDDKDTAYFAPYAKAIRRAVQKYGVFVDCAGGIRTPGTARKLLEEQVCDLIGIGRPLMADKAFLAGWNL